MPQPVQLVEFDFSERETLLAAGQPKGIDAAMRAVVSRIKKQLKVVAELADDRRVGVSPELLEEARAGIEASLAVLRVCPAGEVADMQERLEEAQRLIAEAIQISASSGGRPSPQAVELDPRSGVSPGYTQPVDSEAGFGSHQ